MTRSHRASPACVSTALRCRWAAGAAAAIAGLVGAVAIGTPSARAATAVVVSSSADGGAGSLRAAIATANTPGSTPTTITFAASTNGSPINLTSGELHLLAAAGTVQITGNGPSNTIFDASGQTPAARILEIDSGASVGVSAITLRNGTDGTNVGGGAIYNKGTVSVTNSIISGSSGGIQFGGAVLNVGGTVGIFGSTLSGNNASDGGAIFDEGALTVANSTLSANTAAEGAGIDSNTNGSSVNIENSTIAANTASSDGGGITAVGGAVTVSNSIVADNSASNPLVAHCSKFGTGSITDGGNNLEDGAAPGSCAFATNAVHSDPALGVLQNNGGPTPTMAILQSSPAFGKADTSVCNTAAVGGVDQRSLSRDSEFSGDAACDIGAFEVQASASASPTPAPTMTPTPVTPAVGAATGGLPAALGLAVAAAGIALIMVPARRRSRPQR